MHINDSNNVANYYTFVIHMHTYIYAYTLCLTYMYMNIYYTVQINHNLNSTHVLLNAVKNPCKFATVYLSKRACALHKNVCYNILKI